ncbi:MAG: hypothetical protein R3C19_23435 [Planctomycetaceae bacterium]
MVDTQGMPLTHLQFETLDQQNLQLMQAYALRDQTVRASGDDHDGWLERFDNVDGLDQDSLTQAHGQLIAMGMLKFELASRSVGLRYQISPRGRQALESAARRESQLVDTDDGASEDLGFADDESSAGEYSDAA